MATNVVEHYNMMTGVVTRVVSVDRIFVDDVEVRLAHIYADRTMAEQARQELSRKILNRKAVVAWQKRNGQGCILGIVFINVGKLVDVNLWLVQYGLARCSSLNGTPITYCRAELYAEAMRLGCWAITGKDDQFVRERLINIRNEGTENTKTNNLGEKR